MFRYQQFLRMDDKIKKYIDKFFAVIAVSCLFVGIVSASDPDESGERLKKSFLNISSLIESLNDVVIEGNRSQLLGQHLATEKARADDLERRLRQSEERLNSSVGVIKELVLSYDSGVMNYLHQRATKQPGSEEILMAETEVTKGEDFLFLVGMSSVDARAKPSIERLLRRANVKGTRHPSVSREYESAGSPRHTRNELEDLNLRIERLLKDPVTTELFPGMIGGEHDKTGVPPHVQPFVQPKGDPLPAQQPKDTQ